MKIEFYPAFSRLKEQGLYPLVSYRSDYGIRSHLAAYIDTLYKSCVKIAADSHGRDKRGAEHFTVLEWCAQKVGQSSVCHFLIFDGNAQMKVFPAVAPIEGEAFFILSGRLVVTKMQSFLRLMKSQHPSRHLSASSMKKSEEKHSLTRDQGGRF